jgi:HlyD family secretion protein
MNIKNSISSACKLVQFFLDRINLLIGRLPLIGRIKTQWLRLAVAFIALALTFILVIKAIQAIFGLNSIEYRTAAVEEGSLVATISASGTLNPVKSVTVGTQVTGMIKELDVDFNSPVQKGQVIARIDPREYQARYDQALANYVLAQRNHEFNLKLVDKGFISKSAVVQTEGAYKAALGALNLAKKSLDDTVIHAPVDGVVVKRSVEVGQTVAASLQAPELFIIAQNLAEMQVETSIDESDVGRLAEGMDASFTVDSFPGRVFQSKVLQIRKAPITIQNVVTYTVLISADNPDLKLLPGMTANVRIVVDKRDNVLKVPNAALRFRMPSNDEIAANKGVQNPGAANLGANQRGPRGGSGSWSGSSTRRVWLLEKNGFASKPVELKIRTGMTDGTYTELLPDQNGQFPLQAGNQLIIGIQGAGSKEAATKRQTGPRMF